MYCVVGVRMKGRAERGGCEYQRPEKVKLSLKSDRGIEGEHIHFHASTNDRWYYSRGRGNYVSKSTF